MRSPPQITTAPGGSIDSSDATAASWLRTALERAFILGRSRRTRATPSGRRSTDTFGSGMRAPYSRRPLRPPGRPRSGPGGEAHLGGAGQVLAGGDHAHGEEIGRAHV